VAEPQKTVLHWAVLLGLSALLVGALEVVRLPAALFLGPMVAAIILSARGVTIGVPALLLVAGQGVIGCMIARNIPVAIFGEVAHHWPIFLGGVASVIVVSNMLGWLLARWQVLPGTTAIWGSSPGAATAMVVMADAHGADGRLVAVMQFLRVVCVAAVASLVARFWGGGAAVAARPPVEWFPPLQAEALAATLAIAVLGALAARRLRLPGGTLLLPLALGVAVQDGGWLTITLPPWLLAGCYALVGWSIGLRFTKPILLHVARLLTIIFASTLALIVLCGGFAGILVLVAGIDPLTAYLATSPGGADSVAIIAASSPVDVPFIMAMQTARAVLVLLTGPAIARFIVRRMGVEP
jgi:hypothetical protein